MKTDAPTARLISSDLRRMVQKVAEEATEVVEAVRGRRTAVVAGCIAQTIWNLACGQPAELRICRQLSTDAPTGSKPGAGRPSFPRCSDKPAVSGRATHRCNPRPARALGHEIGEATSDNIELPPPHVVFARWLRFERSEPTENMMPVDPGNRRNVSLRAGADGDIISGRLSAHRSFASGQRRQSSRVRCSSRVSRHAKGSVKSTTIATSSIAGVRPIASPKIPYKAGDRAPAPIVPV